LLSSVSEFLGSSSILAWSSDFNIKPPNSAAYYSLHQDGLYAGLEPAGSALTAWIALSDCSEATAGPLIYCVGMHKHGMMRHTTAAAPDVAATNCSLGGIQRLLVDKMAVPAGSRCSPVTSPGMSEQVPAPSGNLLSKQQTIVPKDAAEADALRASEQMCLLAPGEACLHSFLLPHRSGANTQGTTRVGFAIRFMRADTRKITTPDVSTHGSCNSTIGGDPRIDSLLDAPPLECSLKMG